MAINKNDPYRTDVSDDELRRRRAAQVDNELQPDPELDEGSASAGRIGLFAIAILAILGAVFYGLNNPSITPQPESTAQTTTTTPPANTAQAPATAPSQTTGSSTSSPQQPPQASPAQSGDNTNSSNGSSSTPSMTPAPSPSNSGTTQSGPPANN